jgi:hypothetical protein
LALCQHMGIALNQLRAAPPLQQTRAGASELKGGRRRRQVRETMVTRRRMRGAKDKARRLTPSLSHTSARPPDLEKGATCRDSQPWRPGARHRPQQRNSTPLLPAPLSIAEDGRTAARLAGRQGTSEDTMTILRRSPGGSSSSSSIGATAANSSPTVGWGENECVLAVLAIAHTAHLQWVNQRQELTFF